MSERQPQTNRLYLTTKEEQNEIPFTFSMLLLNALPLANATNLLFPPTSSRLMSAQTMIYDVLTISENPSKKSLKVTLRYFQLAM